MTTEEINLAITKILNPNLPNYTIEETYEDDPHWNNGFYESTISFDDGKEIQMYRRKDELDKTTVHNLWLTQKTKKYCSNLNLMHEAEKVFVQHDGCVWGHGWEKYTSTLSWICLMAEPTNCLMRATAHQRAEAFIKTFAAT